MPESIVLYTRYGAYEPGNRYYLISPPGPNAANIAAGLADAQTELQTNTVSVVRWEHLNSQGSRINSGVLAVPGKVATEFSEFRYCSLLRLNSAGPEKPSTKFVHPLPETALQNGVPTATWLANVVDYENGLLAAEVCDSDGFIVESVSFIRGSRRKNVRIAP